MNNIQETLEQHQKLFSDITFPKAEEIQALIDKHGPFDSKFDQLLIVPNIGHVALTQKLSELILSHKDNLTSLDGEKLRVDPDKPVWTWWDDFRLQYLHGDEWLEQDAFYQRQPIPGFHILLVASQPEILPKKLMSADDWRAQHKQEGTVGLTLDAVLISLLLSIQEKGMIPLLYGHTKGAEQYSVYSKSADGYVPFAYWVRSVGQAGLYGGDPGGQYECIGSRSAVSLGTDFKPKLSSPFFSLEFEEVVINGVRYVRKEPNA